jgi:hypothetical protein
LARATTKIPAPILEFWGIKWTCAPLLECSACYSNTYRVCIQHCKKDNIYLSRDVKLEEFELSKDYDGIFFAITKFATFLV